MESIYFYSRHDEYGWLSNFHRCEQIIDFTKYPSNEHYYQSMKAQNLKVQKWIRKAPSPYLAMKAGRLLRSGRELKDNWGDVKVNVMLKGLRVKFKDPELRRKLLDTGDAILHENSNHYFYGCKGGKDMLGKLLMQVRGEIRNE